MRKTTNAVGWNTTAVAVWLCLGASWTAFGQERGIINKRTSPHSRLQSVDLDHVRWTGGFWKDKFELVKEVTIPEMWDYFNGAGNSHWTNFRLAAGEIDGQW
jgi:uncharacterized protein